MRGASFSQGRDSSGLSQPEKAGVALPTSDSIAMSQPSQSPQEHSVPVHSFSEREPDPDSQTIESETPQLRQQYTQDWLFTDYNELQESRLARPKSAIHTHSSDHIRASPSDVEAFKEMTLCARQQFIATLDNTNVAWPVEQAFPGISANRALYKNRVTRVRALYRTWKNKSLDLALRKFNSWILTLSPRQMQKFRNSTDFILVYQAIASQFEFSWVFDVFPWAQQVLSIDDCSDLARDWLKCK